MKKRRTDKNKEPLMHIVKRDTIPFWKAVLIRLAGVLLALLVCAVVIVIITKYNPINVYKAIISGAVGTKHRLWVTLKEGFTLLLVALALVPAFKMKFWNIGAEGQMLIGGVATAAVMIYFGDKLPAPVLIIVMAAASIAAGIIWGVIPAIFKARWNTNETLFTLMLNYVAIQIVNFCVTYWENPKGSNNVGTINFATESGWLNEALGPYGWHIVVTVLVLLLVFIYMNFSKHGYEIAVVGESENTAKYAGINVKKVIIRTMAISGAIAAAAGFLAVSGADHTIKAETAGGRGFTAIIVAWLAHLNPFVMVFISFLLVFLSRGSIEIASKFSLNESMSEVITGIILFFILGCEFFINYKVQFRKKGARA